ncbi:unnamed protein product [Gadus morhua 'NCC']
MYTSSIASTAVSPGSYGDVWLCWLCKSWHGMSSHDDMIVMPLPVGPVEIRCSRAKACDNLILNRLPL